MNRRSFLRMLSFVPAAAVGVGAAAVEQAPPSIPPAEPPPTAPFAGSMQAIHDPGHSHGWVSYPDRGLIVSRNG